MSEGLISENYYAETVYKPAKRIAWENADSERKRTAGSRLSWYRRTQDNGTKDEYAYNNIIISKNWEKERSSLGLRGDFIYGSLRVHYDNLKIMPPNYSAVSKFLFVSMAVGKGGLYMFLAAFFFLVIVVMGHCIIGGQDFEYFKAGVYAGFIYCFPIIIVCFSLWKGGRFLEKKFPRVFYNMRNKPLWQLNRQNGLFTIYDPKKAWQERLSAPFYEFDAYLESSPDTQGSPTYSLVLYHPETDIRQKLDAQFPPTNMPGELVAAWQFIQRYMDVSQPLPDVPALEIHRHKDPTTAAADERKGRNPRYWRDMTEAEVKKIQEEKYRKNIRLR